LKEKTKMAEEQAVRIKKDRVSNAVAAGVTTVNSDVVDTQGFDGCLFTVHFGAILATAVTSIKAQQGTLADGSDMADLAGTSVPVADTDDNALKFLEIKKPRERYLRCVVLRATANSTIDSIDAELYGPGLKPTTHAAEVAGETHHNPAEGTP